MRRNVCPGMAFSNGTYIFDKYYHQINPTTPEGQIIESILVRQVEDKIKSLPQKYRAEIAHNKDINNDGYIGKPPKKIVDAEIEITPESITIKPKKRKSRKLSLVVEDSSDVAVSDRNGKVP